MTDSYNQHPMNSQMCGVRYLIEAMQSAYGTQLQNQMRVAIKASQSLGPILTFNKAFKQFYNVRPIQKQINSLRIPPQGFTEQLKVMRSLSQTIAPLLKNQDIRVASKANQIFQTISNDPVGSFNEVVKASDGTQKLVANHNNDDLRHQAQLEKQSENSAAECANAENGSDVIDSAIENYQKPINRSDDKDLNLQYSIDFFNYLFHILWIAAMIIGVSNGMDQALTFLVTSLDTLTLYLKIRKR